MRPDLYETHTSSNPYPELNSMRENNQAETTGCFPDDPRERPLPAITASVTSFDYHEIPIRADHPLSREMLVDVAEYGLAGESYYARADGGNAPYFQPMRGALESVWCRKSVAEALARVNSSLTGFGLRLFLFDAYRPVELQRCLWDFFMERARGRLDDPTDENCRRFVGRYWSDPSKFDPRDFRTWPTHATGGAVDLTLQRISTGELLFMGGIFDDTDEVSHTRFFETGGDTVADSRLEARRNRRLLYWSMVREGFANYAHEWWHYDQGTQMWVMNHAAAPGRPGEIEAYYGLAPAIR